VVRALSLLIVIRAVTNGIKILSVIGRRSSKLNIAVSRHRRTAADRHQARSTVQTFNKFNDRRELCSQCMSRSIDDLRQLTLHWGWGCSKRSNRSTASLRLSRSTLGNTGSKRSTATLRSNRFQPFNSSILQIATVQRFNSSTKERNFHVSRIPETSRWANSYFSRSSRRRSSLAEMAPSLFTRTLDLSIILRNFRLVLRRQALATR
jgi:hypothetical protein